MDYYIIGSRACKHDDRSAKLWGPFGSVAKALLSIPVRPVLVDMPGQSISIRNLSTLSLGFHFQLLPLSSSIVLSVCHTTSLLPTSRLGPLR